MKSTKCSYAKDIINQLIQIKRNHRFIELLIKCLRHNNASKCTIERELKYRRANFGLRESLACHDYTTDELKLVLDNWDRF